MTSSSPPLRRARTGTVLTAVAALAAGCGSSGRPAAEPTKTIIVGAAPAAPAPACATRALGVKLGLGRGTAGRTFQVIDFTNISHAPCTLRGYPGVSLAGGTPVTQLGLPAAESRTTPRKLVTLTPGAAASVVLQIAPAANFPAAKCQLVTAHYLRIYPPHQTTPAYLKYSSPTCAKPVRILTISVVQAGSGDSNAPGRRRAGRGPGHPGRGLLRAARG